MPWSTDNQKSGWSSVDQQLVGATQGLSGWIQRDAPVKVMGISLAEMRPGDAQISPLLTKGYSRFPLRFQVRCLRVLFYFESIVD